MLKYLNRLCCTKLKVKLKSKRTQMCCPTHNSHCNNKKIVFFLFCLPAYISNMQYLQYVSYIGELGKILFLFPHKSLDSETVHHD